MPTNTVAPPDPGLALLTGPDAGAMVDAVLAAAGARSLRWALKQVDHQPGRGATASYTVDVEWADGARTREILGACSGELPAGIARISDGATEIGMWRFPVDPDLPALPLVHDHRQVRALLRGTGLDAPDGPVRSRLRVYRPRRRAVFEVSTPAGTAFVKVVRPRHARELHRRHRIAEAAGCPVPAALGWTETGAVVLARLPGRGLREGLLTGAMTLDPDDVVNTLDALPAGLATGERRRTWGQRAPHYAEVIAAAAPSLAERARAVANAVDHEEPEGPDTAVHGDFYEGQLLMRDGRIVGLLDLDTAGRGERLDDAGCLLAHLSLLAELRPDAAPDLDRLVSRLYLRFVRELDPAALSRRAAAVALSLATGPHRLGQADWLARTEDRVALAQTWLEPTNGSPPRAER
ncbi:hypothetical protein SAMN05216266_102341 [Amycolatopsis marina]|uniref:Aminoglycoside phosphotransferase domain-containing protein n=1 Tax=Amycolatopsis marina TaxID=490629 RepID=A0A1I0WYY7_9PSEU|nr:aminoglycoside phosphotransferase family protein [Amycolatopsis marina]SFA93955.1 hypothetical protein SAMN05216266_102341 [Amycolatopsis marina]